jgi:hypothetical protein
MKSVANVLLLCGALLLVTAPALAERVYEAAITGDQQVVPSGSTAYGTATLIMNDAGTWINYTVNFAGLDAPFSRAAFFLGAPGTVGPEALALDGDAPLAGTWLIDEEVANALFNEELYINVFSDDVMFPDGEIRGNFTLTIVAEEAVSFDQVKSLYR